MKKYKKNIALIFLAAAMLFYAIPFGVGATGETENAEPQNRYNVTLTDDSPEYVREIAEKSQIYDEFEVVSLREENVKHFALADGTFKAVVYPYKIHEQDADGKWVEAEEFEDGDLRGSRDLGLRFVDAAGDTYVSSYSPSSNYGSTSKLYVGTSTMRTYILFEKPTIPSNATITYGELDICYWYVSDVTTGYVTVGVYEVESYWNASTLTWNTVQSGLGAIASNAIATVNLYAGVGITSSNPRDELIDITEAVQDWYAGKMDFGIALEYLGGTNSSVGICSMEDDMYPMYMLHYTLDDLPVENGTYFLYNIQLERYLQIDPDAISSDQAYMELWTLDGDDDQKWEISYLHNGYYRIKSVSSGRSLAIKSGKENTNGGRIVQESYTANARQQWAFSWSSNDYIVIRPRSRENYSTDWVMSAAWGIWNGDGREVVQYAYSDDDDLKDEWVIYKYITNYNYMHYYDSTFAGNASLINNISSATNFSSFVYSRLCGLTFSMYGSATQYTSAIADQCPHASNVPCSTADCGSSCGSQHHKNVFRMSDQLYNNGQNIQSGYRYVLWSNRTYGTFCYQENGNHTLLYAIGGVVNYRPIINFYNIDGSPTGTSNDLKKACMAINLVHETAHTFGMPDVYDIPSHSSNDCVMNYFNSNTAVDFYNGILRGKTDAFCESCSATLQQLILNEIMEE